MKKKYVVAAALALFVASASAQDIYKVGLLTSTDLNGDARYVGMGGAMSAWAQKHLGDEHQPRHRQRNTVAMTFPLRGES